MIDKQAYHIPDGFQNLKVNLSPKDKSLKSELTSSLKNDENNHQIGMEIYSRFYNYSLLKIARLFTRNSKTAVF